MPALIDARPAGIDLLFRSGTTLTVVLTWPSGALVGRTFTSTLDGVPLAVGVAGDDLTIEADAALTASLAEAADWLLIEDSEPILVGTWGPSDKASAVSQRTVNVTQGSLQVDVAALTNVGLSSHVNAHQGRNVHGVVAHDWGRDGWTPFTPVTITADGAQSFTQSVSNSRGVLTSTQPSGSGLRIAYLHDDTEWLDSEITSVVYSPAGWTGTNAQQGHIHRVREVSPGVYEGIAVWTAVFGGDYATLNTRAVRWNGTTLWQSDGDLATSADSNRLDRSLHVRAYSRFTFINVLQDYKVRDGALVRGYAAGDIVTVTDMADASFNETDVALAGADSSVGAVSLVDAAAGAGVANTATFQGVIRPSAASAQKRWTPYYMSSRVVGGTSGSLVVEWKRWRPEDNEPDWGDALVQRRTVTTNANVPTLPTEAGACALWGAHMSNGSAVGWGEVRFREL
jgi:hypothetical protein